MSGERPERREVEAIAGKTAVGELISSLALLPTNAIYEDVIQNSNSTTDVLVFEVEAR